MIMCVFSLPAPSRLPFLATESWVTASVTCISVGPLQADLHVAYMMGITIKPLPGKTFGATVRGVELQNLSTSDFTKIQEAFIEYGLLIFPKINVDQHTQKQFASRFGGLRFNGTPMSNFVENYKNGEIFSIAKAGMKIAIGNEQWHFDDTYQPQSAIGGLLSCTVMPSWGGGTGFLDARAAYDDLPIEMKTKVSNMFAWHSNEYSQAVDLGWIPPRNLIPIYHGKAYLRPLVKIHPLSKRKVLYAGRHAFALEGKDKVYNREESFNFLQGLHNHCLAKDNRVYIHQYQVGDLVLFDNRSVMHKACEYDYIHERRQLIGTRIVGSVATESAIDREESTGQKILEEELASIREDILFGNFRPRLATYEAALKKDKMALQAAL